MYLENVSAFERNLYLKKIVYAISGVFRIIKKLLYEKARHEISNLLKKFLIKKCFPFSPQR